MLTVGGNGNNKGAIAGTIIVWALWTLTESGLAAALPPILQKQVATVRVVVGLVLVLMLLYRPQGIFPEEKIISPEARLGGRSGNDG